MIGICEIQSAFAAGYGVTSFALLRMALAQPKLAQRAKDGAGSRDRTGILSLEGCCTTIVLYPRQNSSFSAFIPARREACSGKVQRPATIGFWRRLCLTRI